MYKSQLSTSCRTSQTMRKGATYIENTVGILWLYKLAIGWAFKSLDLLFSLWLVSLSLLRQRFREMITELWANPQLAANSFRLSVNPFCSQLHFSIRVSPIITRARTSKLFTHYPVWQSREYRRAATRKFASFVTFGGTHPPCISSGDLIPFRRRSLRITLAPLT